MSGGFNLGITQIKKLYLGTIKFKKAYIGNTKIYAAGNIVTYNVDTNIQYKEEVENEATCLSPTSFTPTKSGYAFVGWRTDSTASDSVLNSKVMEDSPITLYAVFKKDVSITYYSKTSGTSTKQLYYNNGNIINPTFNLDQGTDDTWSPRGWSKSSDYDAVIDYPNKTNFTSGTNMTLYSSWIRDVVATFYTRRDAGTTVVDVYTSYANYNLSDKAKILAYVGTPEVFSDWTIRGWTIGDDPKGSLVSVESQVEITDDTEFWGSWGKKITVTYQDATMSSAKTVTSTRYGNARNIVEPTFNITQPGLSGWTARGWSKANKGNSAISYNSGKDFSTMTDLTIYGSYQKTVIVKYQPNKGSGEMDNSTGTAYTGVAGDINASITLKSCKFIRIGYTFSTWTEGSTSGTARAPGYIYKGTANVNMFAKWVSSATPYTVDLSKLTATITQPSTNGVQQGTISILPAAGSLKITANDIPIGPTNGKAVIDLDPKGCPNMKITYVTRSLGYAGNTETEPMANCTAYKATMLSKTYGTYSGGSTITTSSASSLTIGLYRYRDDGATYGYFEITKIEFTN